MRNVRDDLFLEGLKEVLETDAQGEITSKPAHFGLVNETRGMLITGETGSGKTAMIMRNLKKSPSIRITEGKDPGEAFYIRIQGELNSKGLASQIAAKTGYTVSKSLRTAETWEVALHRLKMIGISILWIDEVHHIFNGNQKQEALFRCKSIMQGNNALTLILSGIPKLDDIISSDRETSERFIVRMQLDPIFTNREINDLQRFILYCCDLAELLPPSDDHIANRIILANRGVMGRCLEAVHGAIGRCLRGAGKELMLEHFRRGFILKGGSKDLGPYDDVAWPELAARLEERGWAL